MKKNYRNALLGVCAIFLAGCHTLTQNGLLTGSSDQSITASVNSAFLQHPDLATQRIHIETQKGTVFLRGYVKTIRQSDTAGDLAAKLPGVKAVNNGLIVRK